MAELHQVKLGDGTYDAVTKTYVDAELADKQDTLVSGTNVKTVNGESLLGSGDLDLDDIFYITVDGDDFTPTSDPDVYEMELTSPYTLAELNDILQSENPKSMILRLVSTSGTTKTINEVLLDVMAPTIFEGDLFYTETYMEVSHSYAKFIIANVGGKTMLTRRTGSVGGGEEHVELTQAEYDALTDEEKLNGKVYFITDGEGVDHGIPAGGAEGQSLVKKSDADYDAEWKTMPDSQTVLNMLLKLAPPRPFADATWEEISTYLDWHKQGLMNIYDYWSVGDTKVIHMGSYIGTPEKDVEIMLVGTDSRPLSDGTRSLFIWQQRYTIDKDTAPPASATIAAYYERLSAAVLQTGATYNDCSCKNTLDVDYFNALPAEMRALCKEMRFPLDNFMDGAVYTGKVVLPSEFEIFGTRTHDREISANVKQFEYYAAQTNKSFIRRAAYNSSSQEYTYEDTAGWLRSRDINPGTKWTYNNKGVVTAAANTMAMMGILPTGAF